ncbi:MAG: hypothetical protein JRJ38_07935 [Deltaproteobacteria bacterium]|nr:hypothetical protein [Deltaproteobacteria bacterium]
MIKNRPKLLRNKVLATDRRRREQTVLSGGTDRTENCVGRGRMGTVVGCFLARHGMASDHNVLDHVWKLRKNTVDHHIPSPKTAQQFDMVVSWVKGE